MVTSNDKHGVGLWDVRMPDRCVLQYGSLGGRQQVGGSRYIYTSVSACTSTCTCSSEPQASMYASWNCRGDKILGLRRRLPPVLYRYRVHCLHCTVFGVYTVKCLVCTVYSVNC